MTPRPEPAPPGAGASPAPGFTIALGLPETQRQAAAALYWQAFGPKLGRVLGPETRALGYLAATLRRDHALAATLDADGTLLGFAGFRTPRGSFAQGTAAELARAYGRLGAAWRGAVMRAIADEVDDSRFLVDGLCVAPAARGRGVGRALIAALSALAAARGYREMRLDVVTSNDRARALYEREGFRVEAEQRLGVWRHVFGFEAAVTMVRGTG